MSRLAAGIPAYFAAPQALARLRRRRAQQRTARKIYAGSWREVLLDMQETQFFWKNNLQHGERVGQMVQQIGLIELAMESHAAVLAANPPTIDIAEAEQAQAMAELRQRCLLDVLLKDAVLTMYVQGAAALRISAAADGPVVNLEDNERCFPVGPLGPDRQPSVWERRWVIERGQSGQDKPQRYLRIERQRALAGIGGVIEQEIYHCQSCDALQDARQLKPAELAVLGPKAPPPRIATGSDRAAIVELVTARGEQDEPKQLIGRQKISAIDAVAAHLTRLHRTLGMHGDPKFRIPRGLVDEKTGEVDLSRIEAMVDDEKHYEVVSAAFAFEQMIAIMDRLLQWLMVDLRMSQALIGFKPGGGAAPDTYDKLRLEATMTMTLAKDSAASVGPALEVLLTIASQIAAAMPLGGFRVGPVSVDMRPELPRDDIERVREQSEMMAAGLTSLPRAVAAIHGAQAAPQVLAEIAAEQAAQARREQTALFAAAPKFAGGDEDNQPAGVAAAGVAA